MRLGSLFHRKPKPPPPPKPSLDDPFFGQIELDWNGWSGSRRLPQLEMDVDFLVEAGPDGPTQAQRDFYQQIEDRYPELMAQFERDMVGDGAPFTDGSSPRAFFQSLKLEGILLPPVADAPTTWEMAFTTQLDRDHIIFGRWIDWEFDNYYHDG